LTSDVPFRDGLALDVVVDRVAPIAEIAGRAADAVCAPLTMRHVPGGGQRREVVPDALEVALLELAAVDERDLIPGEGEKRIRPGEVPDDRVGMFARVANDVGHARPLPPIEGRRVAPA